VIIVFVCRCGEEIGSSARWFVPELVKNGRVTHEAICRRCVKYLLQEVG